MDHSQAASSITDEDDDDQTLPSTGGDIKSISTRDTFETDVCTARSTNTEAYMEAASMEASILNKNGTTKDKGRQHINDDNSDQDLGNVKFRKFHVIDEEEENSLTSILKDNGVEQRCDARGKKNVVSHSKQPQRIKKDSYLNSQGSNSKLEKKLAKLSKLPHKSRKAVASGEAQSPFQTPTQVFQKLGLANDDVLKQSNAKGYDDDTLLLYALFQKFSSPAPTLAQISNIVRYTSAFGTDNCHSQQYQSLPLPLDAVITSGEGGRLVTRLLTQDVKENLFTLPVPFQLAFFRILIRLIMNETEDEYVEYFKDLCSFADNNEGQTTPKKKEKKDTKSNLDFNPQIRPHDHVKPSYNKSPKGIGAYLLQGLMGTPNKDVDSLVDSSSRSTGKQFSSSKSRSSSNQVDNSKPRCQTTTPHRRISASTNLDLKNNSFLYSIVRFRCGVEWRHQSAGMRDASSFLNLPGKASLSAILSLLHSLIELECPLVPILIPPVARFLGILCTVGISAKQLQQIMYLILQRPINTSDKSRNVPIPNRVRLHLIRAMILAAEGIDKNTRLLGNASPSCFFNFDSGKGLSTVLQEWPFHNEYSLATWFRFEDLPCKSTASSTIVSFRTADGGGVEVALDSLNATTNDATNASAYSKSMDTQNCTLLISVFDSNLSSSKCVGQIRLKGCVLSPRIWHHIGVRHTSPKYKGFFTTAKEEISIFLGGRCMLTNVLKYPKILSDSHKVKRSGAAPCHNPTQIKFAKNFNGQTGALYLFKEAVSDATFQALFEVTSGTPTSTTQKGKLMKVWDTRRGQLARHANNISREPEETLQITSHSINTRNNSFFQDYRGNGPINGSISASLGNLPDKALDDDPEELAMHPLSKALFGNKILLVWDPSRCYGNMVMEGYSGADAKIYSESVQTWYLEGIKDVVSSIGGIQSFLPLFASFLVEDPYSDHLKILGQRKHQHQSEHGAKITTMLDESDLQSHEIENNEKNEDNDYINGGIDWILPNLIRLLSSFIQNHSENSRELLRCGGVDILEHYLLQNRKSSAEYSGKHKKEKKHSCTYIVKRSCESPLIAMRLVEALEDLCHASSHNLVLETKMFSRLLYNIPLWLGGTTKLSGVGMHAALLPLLSTLAKSSPDKVRDCVDVRELYAYINRLTSVGGGEEESYQSGLSESSSLFTRPFPPSGPLSMNLTTLERRHAVDVTLGIVVNLMAPKTTIKQLAPLLNFIASSLDDEREKASSTNEKRDRVSNDRHGSRNERYIAAHKACSVLLFLLQNRPYVHGLHHSFETYLSGANEISSFILCCMVNSFDDSVRSLGIRCLTEFLDGILSSNHIVQIKPNLSFGDASSLDKYTADIPDQDTAIAQEKIIGAASTLKNSLKYVGTGLRNIGNNAMVTTNLLKSKANLSVTYKLLWHLLKIHRDGLDDLSHAALILLLVDNDVNTSKKMTKKSISYLDEIISQDAILSNGFCLSEGWVNLPNNVPVGIDTSQSLRNVHAIGTILRLLEFLSHKMKERWLFDLLTLVRISPHSVQSILPSKDWQPCLFRLLSSTVEEYSKKRHITKDSSLGLPEEGHIKSRAHCKVLDNSLLSKESKNANNLSLSTATDNIYKKNEELVLGSETDQVIISNEYNEGSNTVLEVELANGAESPEADQAESEKNSQGHTYFSQQTESLRVRFDLVLKLYSTLLGHSLRQGGDRAFSAIEQAASMQRVCANGHEVFCILLSHLLAELIENGTVMNIYERDFPERSNPNERNRSLKQSARIVTTAILSNGAEGMDLSSAVHQWRTLRHLTAISVAVVTKSGFGVAELFDYQDQNVASVDIYSGGLHGIRLPDGNVPGLLASGSLESTLSFDTQKKLKSKQNIAEHEGYRLGCVTLAVQLLSLLDAFIFPDSLDAALPASQLHGLALVRGTEPRLAKSQGPLLASLLRLSLLLIAHLEPSSAKFLQCCCRLRCFLHWTLELIRESVALGGYSGAFQDLTALFDRLVLAVVLLCHRALSKCAAVLIEIDSSSREKYFSSDEAKNKTYKRLFRSSSELREIVLAAYKCRNEVLRAGLSLQAYEVLQTGLEDIMTDKKDDHSIKRPKESNIRAFLSNVWVNEFHDVIMHGEFAVPEMVSDGQSYRNRTASLQGRIAVQDLVLESKSIVDEYDNAMNTPFEIYCEDRRLWAETDAVREMESAGDLSVNRLAYSHKADMSEVKRIESLRVDIASFKIDSVRQRLASFWFSFEQNKSNYFWKFAQYPDRLHRRTLLVPNLDFDDHKNASYEGMLGKEREKIMMARDNTKIMKRASEGIIPHNPFSIEESDEDPFSIEESDDDYDEKENNDVNQAVQDEASERLSMDELESVKSEMEVEADWDYVEKDEINTKKVNKYAWTRAFTWYEGERAIQSFEPVTLISLQTITEGLILLTTHALYFHPTDNEINIMTGEKVNKGMGDSVKDRRWRLCSLTEVHGRRYMLRQQALEFFFADTHELFISFNGGSGVRDRFYSRLRNSCKVPMLLSPKTLSPRAVFKRSKITDLWRRRKMSTFDYIMQLNIIAGRTFNDITQYPVFPWILADYTSKTLDLSDSRVFRDLSKPVGALNPNRLSQLIERFNDLDGFPEEEKFLYGSHYSSPGVVLHYLIRQEPFTTMAIELQSGRFDCPDRLFFDVAGTWRSCMTSTSDVKELIPEFFTCPEIFVNTNNYPLGETQTKVPVSNVELPPWANGSASEFVRLHRQALESEFVSQNIHHWIDLIFGYKQRGPEAATAYNMFHHLSYEGAVDLDKITDDVDRKATESHIQNFGQTPSQLLVKEPHPVRLPLDECWSPLCSVKSRLKELRCYTPPRQFGGNTKGDSNSAVISIHVLTDTIIVVYADLRVGTYKWSSTWVGNIPYSFKMDKIRPLCSRAVSMLQVGDRSNSLDGSVGDSTPTSNLLPPPNNGTSNDAVGDWSFGVSLGGSVMENLARKFGGQRSPDGGTSGNNVDAPSFLISCGYWDETVKMHTMDGLRLKCSENGGHRGPITCLCIGDDGGLMITGGQDATCRVWVIDHSEMANALSNGYMKTGMCSPEGLGKKRLLSCCHILSGHDDAISSLAFCSELDVKVSGSVDGVICVHSVRQGMFVRSIHPEEFSRGRSAVRKLALHSKGIFVAHLENKTLQMFTINGVRLGSVDAGENLFAMEICAGGEMLVTGGENCNVVIRTLNDLAVRCVLELTSHGPIRCIAFTPADFSPSPQYMYIGTDDGKVTIVDRDPLQRSDEEYDAGLPLWTVHDGSLQGQGGSNWWTRDRRSKN